MAPHIQECKFNFLLPLLLLWYSAYSSSAEGNYSMEAAIKDSYQIWSAELRANFQPHISRYVEDIVQKLEELSIKDIFKDDTLKQLEVGKLPLSQCTTLIDLETEQPDMMPFIGDLIMEDLREHISSATGEDDSNSMSKLLEALLIASIEAEEINARELILVLAQAVGEVRMALEPVPPYLYDDSLREADGSPMKYHDIVQDNYAQTLASSEVIRTYYPQTRQGVVNIVKKAHSENARIRASGLKHSWNHWVWGVDNQYEDADNPCYDSSETGNVDYFIAMVPYELSDYMHWLRADIDAWRESAKELTFVDGPLDKWTDEDGSEHVSVKVGGAALSKLLMDWSVENGWTLPSVPGTPLFTLGGVVSTNSHGSGRQFPPVADQVLALEYVDYKGEIQYVDNAEEVNAIAGSYGLFGILLSLTLKLNKNSYVNRILQPFPLPMEEVFPRVPEPLPDFLVDMFETYYHQTMGASVNLGMDLPLPELMNNFFNEDGDPKESVSPYISEEEHLYSNSMRFIQATVHDILQAGIESGTADYGYWSFFFAEHMIPAWVQENSPPTNWTRPTVTTTTEAIQAGTGLHTFNILRNVEIVVPIRDDGNGNPDWSTIQEAFWIYQDVVNSYEAHGIYPHDWWADLRLVGNSAQVLSAFYDNPHGAYTLAIACTKIVPFDIWNQFSSDLAFRFSKFDTGGLRRPRHHVGKENPIYAAGMTSAEYFLESFGDQIDLFKEHYENIVTARGGIVKDSLQRFSTKFFDQVLLDCVSQPGPIASTQKSDTSGGASNYDIFLTPLSVHALHLLISICY